MTDIELYELFGEEYIAEERTTKIGQYGMLPDITTTSSSLMFVDSTGISNELDSNERTTRQTREIEDEWWIDHKTKPMTLSTPIVTTREVDLYELFGEPKPTEPEDAWWVERSEPDFEVTSHSPTLENVVTEIHSTTASPKIVESEEPRGSTINPTIQGPEVVKYVTEPVSEDVTKASPTMETITKLTARLFTTAKPVQKIGLTTQMNSEQINLPKPKDNSITVPPSRLFTTFAEEEQEDIDSIPTTGPSLTNKITAVKTTISEIEQAINNLSVISTTQPNPSKINNWNAVLYDATTTRQVDEEVDEIDDQNLQFFQEILMETFKDDTPEPTLTTVQQKVVNQENFEDDDYLYQFFIDSLETDFGSPVTESPINIKTVTMPAKPTEPSPTILQVEENQESEPQTLTNLAPQEKYSSKPTTESLYVSTGQNYNQDRKTQETQTSPTTEQLKTNQGHTFASESKNTLKPTSQTFVKTSTLSPKTDLTQHAQVTTERNEDSFRTSTGTIKEKYFGVTADQNDRIFENTVTTENPADIFVDEFYNLLQNNRFRGEAQSEAEEKVPEAQIEAQNEVPDRVTHQILIEPRIQPTTSSLNSFQNILKEALAPNSIPFPTQPLRYQDIELDVGENLNNDYSDFDVYDLFGVDKNDQVYPTLPTILLNEPLGGQENEFEYEVKPTVSDLLFQLEEIKKLKEMIAKDNIVDELNDLTNNIQTNSYIMSTESAPLIFDDSEKENENNPTMSTDVDLPFDKNFGDTPFNFDIFTKYDTVTEGGYSGSVQYGTTASPDRTFNRYLDALMSQFSTFKFSPVTEASYTERIPLSEESHGHRQRQQKSEQIETYTKPTNVLSFENELLKTLKNGSGIIEPKDQAFFDSQTEPQKSYSLALLESLVMDDSLDEDTTDPNNSVISESKFREFQDEIENFSPTTASSDYIETKSSYEIYDPTTDVVTKSYGKFTDIMMDIFGDNTTRKPKREVTSRSYGDED